MTPDQLARTDASPVGIIELDPAGFRERAGELLDIYVAAMNYPTGTAQTRVPLWCEHSRRPEFRCRIAVEAAAADGPALGLAYGYRGSPGQWWHSEVSRGLPHGRRGWIDDYFELTELHVSPPSQGRGLGEALLRSLLGTVTARSVLLSTPEGENRAWRLYRRTGFVDVLRNYFFTGDPRPFAVLGRSLPLETA